jgi:enoyl-CoA hydratase
MSLTAEMINAQTALDWGLVTEVVAHDQLLTRALEVAESIASNHAGAITAIRSLYDAVAPLGDSDAAYALENQSAREWAKLRAQQIAEAKLSDK